MRNIIISYDKVDIKPKVNYCSPAKVGLLDSLQKTETTLRLLLFL